MLKKTLTLMGLMSFSLMFGQFSKSNIELSSDFVESILIDKKGGEWIGTDEGLNLITHSDNNSFYSNISNKKGLLNSEIYHLEEIGNGFIAAFSNDGISIFNPKTFNFKRVVLNSSPISIYKDSLKNNYWVTTSSSGIYQINNNFEIEFNLTYDPLNPLSLSHSKFNVDNKNTLIDLQEDESFYIATINGFNVYDRDQKTIKRYFKKRSSTLLSNNINQIHRISDSELLINTDRGINIFNTNSKKFSNKIVAEGKNIEQLFEINKNNFALISDGKLFSFNLNDSELDIELKLELDVSESNIKFIKENSNLYGFAKGSQELVKVNLENFQKEVLNFPAIIQTVNLTDNNKILVGTSEGLFKESKKQNLVKNINSKVGFYFYEISKNRKVLVYRDHIIVEDLSKAKKEKINFPNNLRVDSETIFQLNNSLLLFGNKNLNALDLKSSKFYRNLFEGEDLLLGNFDNFKLINTNLYVSTQNGIVKYIIPKVIDRNFKKSLLESQVKYEFNSLLNPDVPKKFSDIYEIDNLIWVADMDEGLKLYDKTLNNFIKDFIYEDGNNKTLATKSVTKLFYNKEFNSLLIASRGDGLFTLNIKDTIFKNTTVKDGLLSNNISDFIKTDNHVWIQTGDGINFIDNNNQIRNINNIDGLNIKTFHKNSLHAYNNNIIISGVDNIQKFNIDEIDQFQKEEFNLNILKIVGYNKENQPRILSLNEDNLIEIDNSISSVEINLYTNSKIKANQIKYFISSDIYEDIISNGYNNKIQLNSIPLYNSEFKLSAVNGSGSKSQNIISLKIKNNPPIWLRIESLVGYFILLISIIYIIVKFKDNQTKKRLESERKSKELEEAKNLQNSMLPKLLPSVEGFEISTYLKSATEVGGDYYDFFHKKGEYFYAICGDATGHGVISGIMVSVTKAGLNGLPMGPPSKILGQLNRIVKRVNFGRLRMSLSVAKFDKNSVELCSAAMPPTYYFSNKINKTEEILVPNLPLGGIESEEFNGVKKDFKIGDVMVMISDGLPELPNPSNDLLNYEKVHNCIEKNSDKSAEEIKDALVDLSNKWAKGVMNPDDITIVVIKKAA
tara:strand:- start:91799 stop:95014 length:3216 start_codon:yes stop_codon:yes gene_type:complete